MSHMSRFDPERHARRLCQAGLPLVVVGLYFGGPVGWPAALLGVGLLLIACYSGRDGFLLVGPFAKSELVRAARRRRPQLVRGLFALAAGWVVVENFATHLAGIDGNVDAWRVEWVNAQVTAWLAVGVAVAVLGQTALLVPGVVSDERAGRRWDVLMATDLRSREIVYGKLLGRLPSIFEPVLVVLPILAILPILGGVPAVGALLYLVTLAATVLALSGVGAFHSLFAKDAGTAGRRALGLVAVYLILCGPLCFLHLLPEVWTFPRWQGWDAAPVVVADVVEAVNMANPVAAAWFADGRRPAGAAVEDGLIDAARVYLAGTSGVFLTFSLLAVRRLRYAAPWANKSPARAARAEAKVLTRKAKTAANRPPVSDAPLTWWLWYGPGGATRRITLGRRAVVRAFFKFVGLFLAVYAVDLVGQWLPIDWYYWPYGPYQRWPLTNVVRGLVLFGLFCMSLACIAVPLFRAAVCIARERAADTLEPVCLTPLSSREIVYQKWVGCATCDRGRWFSLFLIALAGTVTGFVHPLTLLGLTVVVPVAAGALAAVGMVFTVRAKTPAKATRNMVLTVVFGGYALALVGAGLVAGVAQVTGNRAVVRWLDEPALLPAVLPPVAVMFAVGASIDSFQGFRPREVITAGGGIALGLVVWSGVGYAAFNLAVRRFDRGRAA